ncbi:MAG: helix-turn-helix domain-containing protein [Bacillota bacterium]
MAVDEAGNKRPQGSVEGPSSLSALGELLRRTREAKGLALAQAQMDTKIRTKYLEALENGDDAGTPGEAYFKGFLRFYGNYLGLDGTALVARYKEIKAAPTASSVATAETLAAEPAKPPKPPVPERRVPAPAESRTRRESRQTVRRTGGRRFPYALAAAVLVVAVGLIGWAYARSQRAPGNPGGQAGQTAGGGQTGDTSGQTGSGTGDTSGQTGQTAGGDSTSGMTGTGTSGGTGGRTEPDFSRLVVQSTVVDKETTSYTLNVTGLTIDVDTAERCWVRAEADGKLVFEEIIEAGRQMRWTATGKFLIRFGNPGGVRLKVNGAPVDTGPAEQSPRSYEFKVKG